MIILIDKIEKQNAINNFDSFIFKNNIIIFNNFKNNNNINNKILKEI
jgi:hypothetical protein